MSRKVKHRASWLGIYREEECPELQRADPGNGRGRHVSQLVCSVPRLECAKRVHLAKGAEQSDEGTEHRQVCLQSTFGILMPITAQLGSHVGRILRQCGSVVGCAMADDTGVLRTHGGFFVNTET